jgi:hypothetical protein
VGVLTSTLFAGDALLEEIAADHDRISRTQHQDDPAVLKIQTALLGRDPGCLPIFGPDGSYGDETAAAVKQFKIEVLHVDPTTVVDDVGPQTVLTLDAMQKAREMLATLNFVNEYGEALPSVSFTVDDGTQTSAVADAQGVAQVSVNAPASVELDPTSTLEALGDLLDRPWPSTDIPEGIVTTIFTDVPIQVSAGDDTTVVVAARLRYETPPAAQLSGSVRVDGPGGLRVTLQPDGSATVDLQANGGFPMTAFIDPPPPGPAVSMPPLVGWVLPNSYIVRDGDTADALGELFLSDPQRFSELSDHDPIPGETLTLPDAAVPEWLSLLADPVPPPPSTQTWFEVIPDDLLRIFYSDSDTAPLVSLLGSFDAPPSPGIDPVDALSDRAGTVEIILASTQVLGPEPPSANEADA